MKVGGGRLDICEGDLPEGTPVPDIKAYVPVLGSYCGKMPNVRFTAT